MARSAPFPPEHFLASVTTTSVAVSAAGVKRKTPSELRQEQLNRAVRPRNSEDGMVSTLQFIGSTAEIQRKTYLRLVDTYAVTKLHDRSKLAFSKHKDACSKAFHSGRIETFRAFRKRFGEDPCSSATKSDVLSVVDYESGATEIQPRYFRDVTQLSSMPGRHCPGMDLDMAEALKVMAPAIVKGSSSGITVVQSHASQLPDSSLIKNPPCRKLERPPIDLSLKLSAHFLSVDPLHWCHRLTSENEAEGVKLFVDKFEWNDKVGPLNQKCVVVENGRMDRFEVRFSQALHSWVHPAPEYLELYEIALAGAQEDTVKFGMKTTLFRKWEDSFRSLYYMFCHKHCNVFYLCSQQFVVMFERGNNAEGKYTGSHVYCSRSSRGLRKKLQEHGVEFFMPFCSSDIETSALEELCELTEFEKLNPGQTMLVDSRTATDNDSQSLLIFEAGNVHRVFDFLLNFRFLVTFGSATDIPVLYSPVEFSKASLYTPEVHCKYIQCPIENIFKEPPSQKKCIMHTNENVSGMLYSMELKGPPGAYIAPWVMQGICGLLQKSQRLGFEVSFVTDPLSDTLNVAQDRLSTSAEVERVCGKALSLTRTWLPGVTSKMRVVKHLKYSDGLYNATMGGVS